LEEGEGAGDTQFEEGRFAARPWVRAGLVGQAIDQPRGGASCDTGGVFDSLAEQVYRLQLQNPETTLLGRKYRHCRCVQAGVDGPGFAPVLLFCWGGLSVYGPETSVRMDGLPRVL
jgi:hypothetical protein